MSFARLLPARASRKQVKETPQYSNGNGATDDHSGEHDETNSQPTVSKTILKIQRELERAQHDATIAVEKLTQAQAALDEANAEVQKKATDLQSKESIAQTKANEAETAAAPLADGSQKTTEQKAQEKEAKAAAKAAAKDEQTARQALQKAEQDAKKVEAALNKARAEKEKLEGKVEYKKNKLQLAEVEEKIAGLENPASEANNEQSEQLQSLQEQKNNLQQNITVWQESRPKRGILPSVSSLRLNEKKIATPVQTGQITDQEEGAEEVVSHHTTDESHSRNGSALSGLVNGHPHELSADDEGLWGTTLAETPTKPTASTPMPTAVADTNTTPPVLPLLFTQMLQSGLTTSGKQKRTAPQPPLRGLHSTKTMVTDVIQPPLQGATQGGGSPTSIRHIFGTKPDQHLEVAKLKEEKAKAEAEAERKAMDAEEKAKTAEEARKQAEIELAAANQQIADARKVLENRDAQLKKADIRFKQADDKIRQSNPVQVLEDAIESFTMAARTIIASKTEAVTAAEDAKAQQFVEELNRLSQALKADLTIGQGSRARIHLRGVGKAKEVAREIRDATSEMLADLRKWMERDEGSPTQAQDEPRRIFEKYQQKYRIPGWKKYGRYLGAVLAAGMVYVAMLLTFPVSVLTGSHLVQEAYDISLAGVRPRESIARLAKNASALFTKIGASSLEAPVPAVGKPSSQEDLTSSVWLRNKKSTA
jgi:hypothetical protein